MLSGNKLKNAYAFSMAVGEGWLSWIYFEFLIFKPWRVHGLYFLFCLGCHCRRQQHRHPLGPSFPSPPAACQQSCSPRPEPLRLDPHPSQILLDLADLLPCIKEIQDLTVLFRLHGQFLEDFFLKNDVGLLFHLLKLVGTGFDPSWITFLRYCDNSKKLGF